MNAFIAEPIVDMNGYLAARNHAADPRGRCSTHRRDHRRCSAGYLVAKIAGQHRGPARGVRGRCCRRSLLVRGVRRPRHAAAALPAWVTRGARASVTVPAMLARRIADARPRGQPEPAAERGGDRETRVSGRTGRLQRGGGAALRRPHAETLPCKTFDDVFDAVVQKRATHGVVPLENSIGGTIHRNYDLLRRARAADHRRGRARRRALPAGAARHEARGREDRLLASAGAGAVRAVPEGPRRRPWKRSTTRPAAPSWWPNRS